MSNKILFVDDEKNVLTAIRRQLRRDFAIATALGGKQAVDKVNEKGPFAVVVCDQRMPEMDGVKTLQEIGGLYPDTVKIMLTGNADQETVVEAINQGQVFRFLNKPCTEDELRKALTDGLRQYELVTAERTILEQTVLGFAKILMDVLSLVDPEAFGQATRVRDWAKELAEKLELDFAWDLDMAATLAPLGLVAVPPEILKKEIEGNPLNDQEREILESSPGAGRRLIEAIPRFGSVADIVYYQNKSYSGKGFPFKDPTSGTDIPYGARILRVLSDLAKASKGALPSSEDVAEIQKKADAYDPIVLAEVVDLWGYEDDDSEDYEDVAESGDEKVEPGKEKKKAKEKRKPKQEKKDVKILGLFPGDEIRADLYLKNGNLLLAEGNSVTKAHIERMKTLNEHVGIVQPVKIIRTFGPKEADAPKEAD